MTVCSMMHALHSICREQAARVSRRATERGAGWASRLRVRRQLFIQRLALLLAQLLAVRHASLAPKHGERVVSTSHATRARNMGAKKRGAGAHDVDTAGHDAGSSNNRSGERTAAGFVNASYTGQAFSPPLGLVRPCFDVSASACLGTLRCGQRSGDRQRLGRHAHTLWATGGFGGGSLRGRSSLCLRLAHRRCSSLVRRGRLRGRGRRLVRLAGSGDRRGAGRRGSGSP